jgi:AIPR protein
MSKEIEEFHSEFFQEVLASADADGRYLEDSFFELFCNQLVDAGELDTADRAQHLTTRGLRVDGYGGDPVNSENVLTLIICDFNQSPVVETLVASDMDAILKRLHNFLSKSLSPAFREGLEETSPGFGLADLISTRWKSLVKIRLILISNRILSARVDGRPEGVFDGVPVTYSVWDIGRLYRFVTSTQGRESIEIDLENDFGGCVQALSAHIPNAGYQAYLLVIPGSQLAAIYDRYAARLLEQNVRVFLQARGGVNKGIRNTLDNDPDMFFAYNNGLSATADGVSTMIVGGATFIKSLSNLQIVNGGQTTASIFEASRRKVDLSGVFVQVKLSIIDPSRTLEVVPKISEYANSQNRVNAADFFANHPFHIRLEEFSRRILAPSPDGSFRQSKWFYERARGQYQDARNRLTVAQRKYLMLWTGRPDIVSKGAQKNFAEFAKQTGIDWSKNETSFNELYYHHAVAKAIIFQRTEKLVTGQDWFEGGYRANIVAYAISKLSHDVDEFRMSVDFESIWKNQAVSRDTPPGVSNVTEWAKTQACWSRVKALQILWPKRWLAELKSRTEANEALQDAVKDHKVLSGIEAQTAVISAGGQFWSDLHSWGESRKLLTPKELGILAVAASQPNRLPSEKQCIAAIHALRKLRAEGCILGRDVLN